MSTEQIAVVTAGVVGVAGVLAPTLTAWRQRVHEKQLARSDRLFRARSEAYSAAARHLQRERMYLERTLPVIGPVPDPPAELDDEEWARIIAGFAMHASPQALDELEEVRKAVRHFGGAVLGHRLVEQHVERGRRDLEARLFDARLAVDDPRSRALQAIDHAEQVMRDELNAL